MAIEARNGVDGESLRFEDVRLRSYFVCIDRNQRRRTAAEDSQLWTARATIREAKTWKMYALVPRQLMHVVLSFHGSVQKT